MIYIYFASMVSIFVFIASMAHSLIQKTVSPEKVKENVPWAAGLFLIAFIAFIAFIPFLNTLMVFSILVMTSLTLFESLYQQYLNEKISQRLGQDQRQA